MSDVDDPSDREVKRQRLGLDQLSSLTHTDPISASSNEVASTSSSAIEHYRQSISNLRDGSVNLALTGIRKALRIDPENILFNIQAAYAFKAAGRIDRANQAFDNARSLVDARPEENEEERAALEVCQRYLRPFEHLPTEIIATILEAVNAGEVDEPLAHPYLVLHISSKLRQLALSLGTLFKDTARIVASEPRAFKAFGRIPSGQFCLSQLQQESLEFCVSNSRGVVASIALQRVCASRMDWVLDVAERSAHSLTSLSLPQLGGADTYDRACRLCPPRSAEQPSIQSPVLDDGWLTDVMQGRIISIVAAARKLSHLKLIWIPYPAEEDLARLSGNVEARPTSLDLSIRLYELVWDLEQQPARPSLQSSLSALMGNVSNFRLRLNDALPGPDEVRQTLDPWVLVRTRAEALQELRIDLDNYYNITSRDVLLFSKLRKFILKGQWYTTSPDQSGVRIQAPRLLTLAARANSLPILEVPNVVHATLDLENLRGTPTLFNWLAKVPQLERLELRFVRNLDRLDQRDWTPESLDGSDDVVENEELLPAILEALLPRPDGSILCPKLRIMGISCSGENELDSGWTARRSDWSSWARAEESRVRYRCHLKGADYSVYDDLTDLHVGTDLLKLESQRRRLSQGLEPEKPVTPQQSNAASPFSRGNNPKDSKPPPLTPEEVKAKWGHCCALEQILLRGCEVDVEVWSPLVHQPSVETICLPDPLQRPSAQAPAKKSVQGRRVHPW